MLDHASLAQEAATDTALPLVKCLVWDLDNTLWRGTLLEDDTVTVSEDIRRAVVELDQRGVLQSIASRNDHDHAWSTLRRLGLSEYFVLPQIGWGRKSDSIRAIAKQLDFAHDTIAFIDDQPAERAEVAFELPDIRCYDAGLAESLLQRGEFSPERVTPDARRRRLRYQASVRREEARAQHSASGEDFLRSLQLVLRIERAALDDIARVEELTLRTSQMNATGIHYSEATLRALLNDPVHRVLVATLSDRFGDHGAIGVILLERQPSLWHLKLLATSCRVVSFGTGGTILNWLVNEAAAAGLHMVADFRPTNRNRMMEVAYRFAGFAPSACERCTSLIHRALLDEVPGAEVQRLHLVPSYRTPSSTMTLHSRGLDGALPPCAAESACSAGDSHA